MRRVLIAVVLVGLSLLIAGFSPVASPNDGNNGEVRRGGVYPKYGFGSQFIYPSGGLSSRIWVTPRLGGEANAILWSNRFSGVNGTVSLRFLSKLSDGETVDFYLATGGAYNFGPAHSEIALVGTGGISFRVFSDNFRLNLEFGMQGRGIDRFGMTFGSGFHYYF